MKHFHWNIRVKNWSSLQFSLVNVNKHLRYIFSTVCRHNERKLCVVVVYVRHLSSTTYMYGSSGGVQAFRRHIVLREEGACGCQTVSKSVAGKGKQFASKRQL